MENLPVFNVFFISIVLILLGSFCFLYSIYKKQEAFEHKEEHLLTDYKVVMRHAHQKARHLLGKTAEQAETMLTQTHHIDQSVLEDLENTLAKVINQHIYTLDRHTDEAFGVYKKALADVKEMYLKELKESVEQFKAGSQTELADFKTMLTKETVASQAFIGKKITDEFETAQKDIADYKAKQLEKIDKQIDTMVQQVSLAVLKQAISAKQHEELIDEALEQAKKEGLFGNS